MGVCCVEGCESGDGDDVTYFPFPIKPALRRKWREAIKTTTKLHDDSKVCSKHFNKTDYEEIRGKLRLKGRVVPSLFDLGRVTRSRKRRKEASKSPSPRPAKPPTPQPSPPRSPSEYSEDQVIPECVQTMTENGDAENCTIECAPEGILPEDSASEPEDIHKEDIEDIIANYHIKQNKKIVERLKASELQEKEIDGDKEKDKPSQQTDSGSQQNDQTKSASKEVIIELEEDPGQTDPVYIEIPVEAGNKTAAEGRDDCLMVLENVQVDIDPSTLMLEHMETDRNEDPISLLTSSDEDDVILQEPHIDTVEVSDETDEDDVPLVRLVKTEDQPDQPESNFSKILWGSMYEYFCVQCHYTTTNPTDFKNHKLTHTLGKIFQVCEICNFTTASKAQFARHKKRHREEKRYKCNLCEYRAKHNMSLIYHMKSHQKEIRIETINLDKLPFKNRNIKKIKYAFKCHSCNFKSNVRQDMLRHVKACCDGKRFSCDSCGYKTNRRSDLKRHMATRHNVDQDDDDEDYVPK